MIAKDSSLTHDDPRWAAVVARDKSADGSFYYSVATTGIYCRPSCSARLANPKNVRFHATQSHAELAGFRACKRCRPSGLSMDEEHAKKVALICQIIQGAEEIPQLSDLAESVGLSAFHFHRVFKRVTGVTPKAFAQAHQADRVRTELGKSSSVTEAIYTAGFNSSGRFYERSGQILGMTPSEYRAGGKNAEIRFAVGETSLGSILVAMSAKGVCAILLGDDAGGLVRELQDKFPKAKLTGGDEQFEKMVSIVVGFVELPGSSLDLPLDIQGTAFQQRVWQALLDVPVGSTASYSDIALAIGAPKAQRAVAAACAANKLAVAIPCHRVVRNDGALSGYRWGVERKRELLIREAAAA